ncbi:hypothetical protein DEO72_LG2g2743 [Vigna unguiculata]|uniref:Uncharacterized protein n=2 Tax=Vigna unguiculata TaxID=3917 RepID=A0A4D6L1R0_VIGUN|nr:hypothetical protein DEO72_LG2g2743 [Vigna unguiculata]
MHEEEDTICVEMMRKLWWLTQIYFRMGATPARSMADGARRRTRGGREAGAGMNCASLWFSAAMDLCVWRAAAFSGEEDGREVVADMEMEARVWEVEGDDVATCYWLNFELLDHDTCETERQQMREEEDTICVEMMRKLWWLTQIYFRMGATPARSMADGAGRKTRGGREAGAGMNCASLWFSAAMDLCVWRAAAFSGEEDGREVVADMEMEARVWEVEGDDVATCYWLNFELLDHDTWHYIIG